MDISLIIPVYNEEQNLRPLYKELKYNFDLLNKEYEIIFVNDGSIDSSPDILNEINKSDRRVKIIHFKKNYGVTSALDAGLHFAKGEFVLTIDADLQCYCSELIKIYSNLQENDVVICSRRNRRKSDGFMKMFSSRVANSIRNAALGENFQDAGCFLRGFRKHCLEGLVLYRGFQVFMPSLMKMAGFKIKEIEIECLPRKYGRSNFNIRNRLWKELQVLLIIKWIQKNRLIYKIRPDTE